MAQTLTATKITELQVIASYNSNDNDDESTFIWGDFLYEIKEIMTKMNTSKFYCFSKAMGWNRVAGYNVFDAETSSGLMRNIMPNTSDLTIEVYKNIDHKNAYDFIIYHHDSPTGDTLTLLSQHKARRLKLLR